MIIKENQLVSLGLKSHHDFIEKTVIFLRENTPEWAASKEDDEIKTHIENMIVMARDRNIAKEINIQKLLYHCYRYGLPIPFSKRMEELLAFDILSEDERVKRLIKERSGHVS